jgi:hypothetical protein
LKKPVALLLGLAALSVAGAETASAQYYYGPGPGYYGQRYYVPGLAPWRVARIVRSAGLTPLSAPARRGPIYEVVAIDPEGRHMRVAVDAYRGAITSVRPVAVLRPNSEPYGSRGPNGEPYGSRIAVAPPALPEQDDVVPGPRLGPMPSQTGNGRIPPQALPPYAGSSQANVPQPVPQQHAQPPQATQPGPNPRIANAPAVTGATPPVTTPSVTTPSVESQRTPIPRPRPSAAATAAVTPVTPTPSQAPAAAATAPAEVPEAPPAPIRPRPSASPTAAAASASAKPPTPANTPPATGSTSSATAKTEPRPPTTMVPVAPLE